MTGELKCVLVELTSICKDLSQGMYIFGLMTLIAQLIVLATSYVGSRKYRSSRNEPFRSWGVALASTLYRFLDVLLISNKITKEIRYIATV